MSEFIEVKTADLIGPALDWATGIALGKKLETRVEGLGTLYKGPTRVVWLDPFTIERPDQPIFHDHTYRRWEPSTSWDDAGPLVKKYGVMLSPPASLVHRNYGNYDKRNGYYESGVWSTTIFAKERKHRRAGFSHESDPLIPAMRAIVQFELGDVVSVPAELMP